MIQELLISEYFHLVAQVITLLQLLCYKFYFASICEFCCEISTFLLRNMKHQLSYMGASITFKCAYFNGKQFNQQRFQIFWQFLKPSGSTQRFADLQSWKQQYLE